VNNIFDKHTPKKLSRARKARYERAVEWMRAVSREDISIEGAPMLPEEERSSGASFRIRSNHKRVCNM